MASPTDVLATGLTSPTRGHAPHLEGSMKKLLLLVTAGTVAAVALALPAFAGKTTNPYLNVSMSASGLTATSTSSFTLSGCGYSKLTTVIVWHNGTGPYKEITPDANGCVSASFSPFGLDPSGAYQAQSWQMQGSRWAKAAEVSFDVA
jgi:hypothetical protein